MNVTVLHNTSTMVEVSAELNKGYPVHCTMPKCEEKWKPFNELKWKKMKGLFTCTQSIDAVYNSRKMGKIKMFSWPAKNIALISLISTGNIPNPVCLDYM